MTVYITAIITEGYNGSIYCKFQYKVYPDLFSLVWHIAIWEILTIQS